MCDIDCCVVPLCRFCTCGQGARRLNPRSCRNDGNALARCCCSSGVEHIIGNDEAESSILSSSTIFHPIVDVLPRWRKTAIRFGDLRRKSAIAGRVDSLSRDDCRLNRCKFYLCFPQMRRAPTGAASFDLVARGRLATLQTVHLSSQQFRVGALRCGIFHNGYNVMRSHNILVNARGRGIISSQLMGNRCLHVPLS